jgi:hypothetical protein
MVTATQFITIREQALLDLASTIGELKDSFYSGNECKDTFKKIEDIFADVRSNAIVFAEKNEKILPKWVTSQKGKVLAWSLGAATVALILLNSAIQVVQFYNDTEASPLCIEEAHEFEEKYLRNITSSTPIPPLRKLCVQIDDASGPSLSLYLLVGTIVTGVLQALTFCASEKFRDACDEYERTKLQIENRTIINDELAAFFTKWKEFDTQRNKENLKSCAKALSNVSNRRLISMLGAREEFISNLAERVEDGDLKNILEQHSDLIKKEFQQREGSPRDRSRHHNKLTGRGNKHTHRGERSSLEEAERRRLSSNAVPTKIASELVSFMDDLDIDFIRLGEYWVDKEGNIAKTSLDPILHRRGSDTPSDAPFLIPV